MAKNFWQKSNLSRHSTKKYFGQKHLAKKQILIPIQLTNLQETYEGRGYTVGIEIPKTTI